MSALKQFTARLFGRRSAAATPAPELRVVPEKPSLRSLRITKLSRETAESVVLWLEDVSGAPLEFKSGQFLTLSVELAGERLFRSYSICSAPRSGEVAVAIKRVQGGRVSNYLNDNAAVGAVIEARGPSGRFTLAPSSHPRRVRLIAGGSGVTPLLSHARHLLASEPGTSVLMLYGNRGEADVMFRGELEKLALQYPRRFVLRHVLSEPSGTLAATPGILDAQTIRSELGTLAPRSAPEDVFLVCGPEPMMDAAQVALSQMGIPREQVLEERFTNAPVAAGDGPLADGPLALTIRVQGVEKRLTITPGETLLDAALRGGVQLDYSCATGACGTCVARLVEGEVQLDEPHCLSAAERKQGMILPCVSRATSACQIEV